MNRDHHLIYEQYKLHGVAAGKTVQDIAKKHNASVQQVQRQIEAGAQVELEHTGNRVMARKIATDHVFEDLEYYSKLKQMEQKSVQECWDALSDEHQQLVHAYLDHVRGRVSRSHRQDVRLKDMADHGVVKELHVMVPGQQDLVVHLDTQQGTISEPM